MTAPAQAAPLRPEAEGTAAQELRALTAFCLAPDDDILATPDSETWAAARLLDGLGIIAHGAGTPVSAAMRAGFGRPSADPDGVFAWPLTGARLRPDDGAYVLGIFAFSENYADTGLGSVAHLNSIVVPALLIAIQQRR